MFMMVSFRYDFKGIKKIIFVNKLVMNMFIFYSSSDLIIWQKSLFGRVDYKCSYSSDDNYYLIEHHLIIMMFQVVNSKTYKINEKN
jgi:hypothetical protein